MNKMCLKTKKNWKKNKIPVKIKLMFNVERQWKLELKETDLMKNWIEPEIV